MYLSKEQADEIMRNWHSKLLEDYDDKLMFIVDLLKSDDWTFVIKSHSLIESLLNELVDAFMGKHELTSLIEKLPLHGKDISKISIAKALGAIEPKESDFITRFSEIRNKVVHRFDNINFTFDNYIQSLDKNQLKNLKSSLVLNTNPDTQSTMEEYYQIGLIWAIWFALFTLIVELIMRINLKKSRKLIDIAAESTSAKIIQRIFSDTNK